MAEKNIAAMSAAIRQGEHSSEELVGGYLKRIKEKNGELAAYLEIYDDAIEQARKADQAIRENSAPSPLAGIPIAVKDNILVAGRHASAGSNMLAGYRAAYDATVIKKLRAAGAVFIGRTNMDEFAMGSSTENSAFGPTKNPHDVSRVPGGSSGGSAAAVAADLAPAALGSDTGGSIRQPASFCGVVGFKPTYGSVSRSGLIAMASSLDQIGPIARTVGDARLVFDAIRGPDVLDATTKQSEPGKSGKKSAITIGLPQEYFGQGLDPDVEKLIRGAVAKLGGIGVTVKEVSLPHAAYALAAYYVIMPAEVSANLARFDGIRYGHSTPHAKNLLEVYEKSRAEGLGPEPKRRIMLGTFALSHGYYDAYYVKAQKVRRLIRDDFNNIFKEVDFIVGPTAPTPAFPLGEKTEDPLAMYLADIYTVAINLAGVPALSLPVGRTPNDPRLPVGLQIIGPRFDDDRLLAFAEDVERNIGYAGHMV